MTMGAQLQSTPRERFMQLIIYASAEISLLTAVLLMFFLYSYGESINLAAFSLAVLLVGSVLLRHSVQVAQIVLILSILVSELIFLLNFKVTGGLPLGAPPEILPAGFLLFDLFILYVIVRNSALPGER
jgi:hypothetical protein